MPPRAVKKGSKRARQYEHIKDSQRRQGNEARNLGIEGRSQMNKAQLQRAVDRKKG